MKNLLSIILFCAFALTANAQSTLPRFGTTPSQDNTGRALNYKFVSTADAVGADTVKLTPSAFETVVIPSGTITDSLSYSLKSLVTSFAGDMIAFSFINSAGASHKIKFVGSNWQFSASGSSITLTTAKRARINFMFDGTQWVETSRMVQ